MIPRPGGAARLGLLALLLVLAVAAALAWQLTTDHYDARDREAAVRAVQFHSFGPSTRARVTAWLSRHRPGRRATWTAEIESRAARRARVDLRVDGPEGPPEGFRWHVRLPDREVEPADEATRALGAQIAAMARE